MLISPLARKICQKKGIDPTTLHGTGPRGRIMAADVEQPAKHTAPVHRGETVVKDFAISPTREAIDDYYVYDNVVNMGALARISLPIAVQCEKLLEQRYALFDFIIRAVVKASIEHPSWLAENTPVNLLLFAESGEKVMSITDAARKSVYRIAKERQRNTGDIPADFCPHIAVCDTDTTRQQIAASLGCKQRPLFVFVTQGHSPKTEIRAGGEDLRSVDLPYTFYIYNKVEPAVANRIAARLGALLYNPINLLMQS